MINRAKKAFPGMMVSLMLAVPAAAHADPARGEASPAPLPARSQVSKNETRKPQAARRAGLRKMLPVVHRPQEESGSPVWSDGSGVWRPDSAPAGWRQDGTASWYGGPRWHGKMTTGGERYDEQALTAAHATLPMGSRVRVTEPSSGRSVVVTINDRPGTRRRVIDLSRAAASELGIIQRGVATVSLTRD